MNQDELNENFDPSDSAMTNSRIERLLSRNTSEQPERSRPPGPNFLVVYGISTVVMIAVVYFLIMLACNFLGSLTH